MTNLYPDSSRKKEKNQINKIRKEKGEVTRDNAETQRIIRDYFGKDLDAGRDWGHEEKGMTENEMAGWHHRLDGHEFE